MQNSGLSIFGFPLKVRFFFFIVMAMIVRRIDDSTAQIAVGAMAGFSILVHELGHAFAYRSFGSKRIAITLTGFGGQTECWDAYHLGPGRRALVSLAGPFAELFFLALPASIALYLIQPEAGPLGTFLVWTVYLNLLWPVFNLLPILDLDGGHVLQHLAHKVTGKDQTRVVRIVSLIIAASIATAGLAIGQWFLVFIMGYFAFNNLKGLRSKTKQDPPQRPLEMDLDYRNKPTF